MYRLPEIMSEKFSLKWNDYQVNWSKALNDLQTDTDLADIVLISDDKVEFSAHRILLSSCSNMFKFIFKSNKNSNPLLFLCGINSVNLRYILDYIYHGEVNIFQDQLDNFLESAQKLEIKGLLGNQANFEESLKLESDENLEGVHSTNPQPTEKKSFARIGDNTIYPESLIRDYAIINMGSMTPEEIKTKMKELYEKTDDGWRCLVCDHTKSGSKSSNIRQHVETHMEGLSFTCNMCDKEFRSRNILAHHKKRSHKNLF